MPTTIDQRDITLTEHGRPTIKHSVAALSEYTTLGSGYSLETRSTLVTTNNPAGETSRHELRIVRQGVVRATFFWETVATWEGAAPAYWSLAEDHHSSTPPHTGSFTGTRPAGAIVWTPAFNPSSDWWFDAFLWATWINGFSATIAPVSGTDIEFVLKVFQSTTLRFEGKLKFDHRSWQVSTARGQLRVAGVTTNVLERAKAGKKPSKKK